ncbi:MAG: hypothetical protein ABIS21_03170 [Acidimicrobiales bacterium]
MVSAVVTLHPDSHAGNIAKAKSHFTSAGLEVHAPFSTSFSVGGAPSRFESVFGEKIEVDDTLLGSVTTEGGGLELRLDSLPEEIRDLVESVAFLPPPDFTPGS